MKRIKRVEILLTEEEDKKFEEIAKKLNMPKGRAIRNLALIGLEDAELYEKLGFFKAKELIDKTKSKIEKLVKNLKTAKQY